MASFSGATEPPSPVISVVMPWKILDGRCGFDQNGEFRLSEHVDEAGRDDHAAARRWCGAPVAAARLPIAAILPPRMAMSAAYQGEPVPSMTRPLRITTS